MEHFTVKHYIGDSRPTLKGNGFDGLEVGRTREDAQDFVTFLNAAIREAAVRASAQMPKDDEPGSLVFAARHALSDLKWAQERVSDMNFQSSITLLEAALKGRV